MEENFTYWGMGKLVWLTRCTSALTIKKKCIHLIVQNVRFEDRDKCPPPPLRPMLFVLTRYETVVQAQLELGGGGGTHCEYGFRHIPASLRTWIFWTVSNSRILPAILKTISANSCQLQPYGVKVSPCNYATTSQIPHVRKAVTNMKKRKTKMIL